MYKSIQPFVIQVHRDIVSFHQHRSQCTYRCVNTFVAQSFVLWKVRLLMRTLYAVFQYVYINSTSPMGLKFSIGFYLIVPN